MRWPWARPQRPSWNADLNTPVPDGFTVPVPGYERWADLLLKPNAGTRTNRSTR